MLSHSCRILAVQESARQCFGTTLSLFVQQRGIVVRAVERKEPPHALLHGHFVEAIRYNYFLPWVVVFLLVFIALVSLKRVKSFALDFQALLLSLSIC